MARFFLTRIHQPQRFGRLWDASNHKFQWRRESWSRDQMYPDISRYIRYIPFYPRCSTTSVAYAGRNLHFCCAAVQGTARRPRPPMCSSRRWPPGWHRWRCPRAAWPEGKMGSCGACHSCVCIYIYNPSIYLSIYPSIYLSIHPSRSSQINGKVNHQSTIYRDLLFHLFQNNWIYNIIYSIHYRL